MSWKMGNCNVKDPASPSRQHSAVDKTICLFETTSTGPESINQDVIITCVKWKIEKLRRKRVIDILFNQRRRESHGSWREEWSRRCSRSWFGKNFRYREEVYPSTQFQRCADGSTEGIVFFFLFTCCKKCFFFIGNPTLFWLVVSLIWENKSLFSAKKFSVWLEKLRLFQLRTSQFWCGSFFALVRTSV